MKIFLFILLLVSAPAFAGETDKKEFVASFKIGPEGCHPTIRISNSVLENNGVLIGGTGTEKACMEFTEIRFINSKLPEGARDIIIHEGKQ